MGEEQAPRKTKIIVIILVVSIVTCSALLGGAIYLRVTEEDRLREGLIENCQHNGNPLRKAVRGILEDQIRQSENVDLSKFFPGIPPSELEALIEEENDQRREHIQQLHPVPCKEQYK